MPLERLVLKLVVGLAALWLSVILIGVLFGIVSAGPMALVPLLILCIGGYLLGRAYAERRSNTEDDYYENTFDK